MSNLRVLNGDTTLRRAEREDIFIFARDARNVDIVQLVGDRNE